MPSLQALLYRSWLNLLFNETALQKKLCDVLYLKIVQPLPLLALTGGADVLLVGSYRVM